MQSSFAPAEPVTNQFITDVYGPALYLKREDLLHPEVSGNKFRKLKYNLREALLQKKTRLLTFGGAYSNHIAATAAAGKLAGIETIGIIRGEELAENLEHTLKENQTLSHAHSSGMKLKFISREAYRQKDSSELQEELRKEFGDFYLLPEGGTNPLAIKGCEEILTETDADFEYICCPVGTGGTIAGIINSAGQQQRVLGFPALKGDFLAAEIEKLTEKNNWQLIPEFHFGGYAKVDPTLVDFINNFKNEYSILPDPVYTGKMLFGIFELMKQGYFQKNPRILAVHTGGFQGIAGMNQRLKNKNYPLINV